MSLTQSVSDVTIPLGDPLHLGEVVRPKLDHSKQLLNGSDYLKIQNCNATWFCFGSHCLSDSQTSPIHSPLKGNLNNWYPCQCLTSQLTCSRSTSLLSFVFLRTSERVFEASLICNSSKSSPMVSFIPNVLWPMMLALESLTILKLKTWYLFYQKNICIFYLSFDPRPNLWMVASQLFLTLCSSHFSMSILLNDGTGS